MTDERTWTPSGHARGQLVARFGIDAISAASTAILVSPLITLIDSTIIIKAASGDSFWSSMSKFVKPISRLPYMLLLSRPSRLVFAVYFGTYVTANCIDTVTATLDGRPAETVAATTSKFAATAVVATGLTVYKDSRLAQMFGKQSRSAAVPLMSYGLFAFRDAMTIFASFNLPTILAPKLSNIIETESRRLKTAQFMIPAAIQFITTPVHLLGLDLHNRRGAIGLYDRAARIGRDMKTAIPARIVRITPAFGVGGVANLSIRTTLMQRLEGRYY